MYYTLTVGEVGNEQGHVVKTKCKTLAGAKGVLTRILRKYRGDGWGIIQDSEDQEVYRTGRFTL